MSETTGDYSRVKALADYDAARIRGDFEKLPDGEVMGFVEGQTATGPLDVVFFILRRFVPYEGPNQGMLLVKKEGIRLVPTWWTREKN